jgi:hypothetical protein
VVENSAACADSANAKLSGIGVRDIWTGQGSPVGGTDHSNRVVPPDCPLEVDLASFGPGVTFGFELGLELGFGLKLGFDFEFSFCDGEIDHEAESVGKLPCR